MIIITVVEPVVALGIEVPIYSITLPGSISVQATAASLVGQVSQAGGVATGALVQHGSNANGEYVRWAEGTQMCWRTNLSVFSVSTATGALFRSSSSVGWSFPAAFAAPPFVHATCDGADVWMTPAVAPSVSGALFRALASVSIGTTQNVRAMAVGRWF